MPRWRKTLSALGGKDNIVAVTHLHDATAFRPERRNRYRYRTPENISGVLGVVRNDNQCRVIIGNTVLRLTVRWEPAANRPAPAVPEGPEIDPAPHRCRSDALIGTMSPLIPAIIGGSMVKLLAMILEMTGVLGERRAHHFDRHRRRGVLLPAADGGSIRRGEIQNQHVAGDRHCRRAGAPELYRATAKAAQGEHVEFAFIPVTAVKYTYTVIRRW